MSIQSTPTRYVTARRLARLLDCHVATVYRMVQAGTLPAPKRIGNLSRFDMIEVQPRIDDSGKAA